MKIEGVRKLLRQLDDLPQEVQASLFVATSKTARLGVAKAKAVSPVVTGDLISKYSWHAMKTKDKVLGFINFHDGTKEAAIKFGAVNYGRKGQRVGAGTRLKNTVAKQGTTEGYAIREVVKAMIAERHKRQMQRALRKAIKDALNG